MSNEVYFQGFGLPLTHDYSGSMMVRDENKNGRGCDPKTDDLSQGFNCSDEEWTRFTK